ncbi:hypothetical protein DFQ28_001501 [Apophysomyces sp. BC1034]|nr:hypothetical protein DFQ30_008836 [Apophysomyces sp. BC1015]KAG0180265.1 hypothetical protein DFQ29_000962 [Apophysomyces sp. BC1021]KAG0190804.1 hypothetical protein DFQ28_001501 [Apophysomyces sp. BC1034]
MPNWTTITIPETPSPNYVIVKNISPQSSEKTVKEFFLFCGKIKEFELIKDDDDTHQIALIHFERESAAKTAALLSNALIDECHIIAAPYFESASSADSDKPATEDTSDQETKPKTRVAAELLANGYILQDHIVAKGLEYDHKFGFSTRFQGYLASLQANVKNLDAKYRIWDKAVVIDQKFKIQEKVQSAAQTAQTKAQEALQTPTGQKVHDLANQTLSQIAAVHYEAKKIQGEKLVGQNNNQAATAAQ